MLNRGLNLFQIGILLFLWSVMTIVLEVPTGALADRWSRRKMLILSGLFFSWCYLVWSFSYSFWFFLLGFLLRTLGGTFASGTLQAYVFDFLKTGSKEEQFEKIWGKGNAFRTLGIGLAVGLGGFISEVSFSLTALLSSLAVLVVSLTVFFWPELKPVKSTEETKYWQFIKDAGKTVWCNKNLLQLTLYTALVLAVLGSLEEYNDVYLNFLGFSRSAIGLIFSAACVLQSIASSMAYKFKQFSRMILNGSAVVAVMVLLAVSLFKTPLMAIAILSLGVILEFVSVLKEGLVQKEIKSYQRATVSSVNELLMNLLPYQLLFGFLANKQSLLLGYRYLALFVLFYPFFLLFLGRSRDPETSSG